MTEWTHAVVGCLCGRCGGAIPAGAPMLVIATATWRKVRGECCAGTAPPDLPAEAGPTQRRTKAMVPLAKVRVPDWRAHSSGESR